MQPGNLRTGETVGSCILSQEPLFLYVKKGLGRLSLYCGKAAVHRALEGGKDPGNMTLLAESQTYGDQLLLTTFEVVRAVFPSLFFRKEQYSGPLPGSWFILIKSSMFLGPKQLRTGFRLLKLMKMKRENSTYWSITDYPQHAAEDLSHLPWCRSWPQSWARSALSLSLWQKVTFIRPSAYWLFFREGHIIWTWAQSYSWYKTTTLEA